MSAIPKSEESILLREDRDGLCTLTLNRPAQMNLLTTEMLEALQEAFEAIAGDRRVRVVVLAAKGKGFCAGHDIKEIRALKERPKIEELFAKCSRMMQTITAMPQPVIARETLMNVPKEAFYNWDPGAFFGIYHPDTFWFKQ